MTHRSESEVEACFTQSPRNPYAESTEQCGGGDFGYREYTGPAARMPYRGGFRYVLSSDYQTILMTIRVWENNFIPDFVRYTWDTIIEIPYTSDWFLTPIVLTATSAAAGLDPADATLTISVCGYEVVGPDADCFTDPLFVDIEFVLQNIGSENGPPTLTETGGTFALTWDGSLFSSAWVAVDIGTMRVTLKPDTTALDPATHCGDASKTIWEVAYEYRNSGGAFVYGQTLGYICKTCGVAFGSDSFGPDGVIAHPDDAGWQINANYTIYG